ncbi:hypothetical protein O181_083521 [Austropuccinia psidii MF-1]|uniref:Retrotransposon gag domain-containing protein n=1 Tax=Austropuccinia psidii MF-1 TaxID=1389203 RepID=A0A9Q3IHY0_9BASI|nr:hypothetical protein [Austropuccinia psidii MF-1]
MELDSEVELIPQKGKERAKSPVEHNTHKEVPYAKGTNHIQRAQIDIYMSQYKQYYTVYKDKDWEMFPQIHQGVMNSWHILNKFLKEEEIVRYSNGWNPPSYKPRIKKKEATKEEAPVASTRKPQANGIPQEGKNNKKKELEKTILPKLQDYKNSKRCNGQCLQNGQNLDGIQGQGGAKNETTLFPKEITLSPDVLNTLTEIKNSILPPKEIQNSLLSLQEINNNSSSLTKIVVKNKKEIDNIKFIVENNKPKVLIYNTQKLIQGQQELYKYIKDIKDKTLTFNYDVSIDTLTEKLSKLSISVEKFEEKTSSHQIVLLDHVEKSDEARMNLKDDIQSEIRLFTEKMDKINEPNLNMPKLSTPFSHIRSPVKPKEEITNKFMTDLSHQDNNQVLMKEAPQLKEWPIFEGEGENDHMSFIKKIKILQEDYSIPDELFTARLHSLFERSAKRWYYGISKRNGTNTWSWWKQEIISKCANDSWRYKIKNSFENSFFDPDKDKPFTWLLKQA